MEFRRVVITGLGAVTPVGNNAQDSWNAVKQGKSGISKITLFDAENYPVKIAGEVKDFNLDAYNIDKKLLRKMARQTKFLMGSCIEAVTDAGYNQETLTETKCGIVTGVGIGTNHVADEAFQKMYDPKFGPTRIPPLTAPMLISNESAANVAIYYQIHGPAWTLSTACASGTDAISLSTDLIRSGKLDICLASGTDANITPLNISSYSILQALCSSYNDKPEKASRPFDKDRAGFVMSEGSACLFLEEYEHAKARGAHIYAELAGTGTTCDAYHITAPCDDGKWAAKALSDAIEAAGVKPEEIQYYNAHGTSTHANDSSETTMLKSVFGEYAKKLHISSTKSETGHMIGAAGVIEALFCVKALEDNFVPPTINCDNPDVEGGCDLDYTPNKGISVPLTAVASCSLGFGGHNGAVVIKKL